MVELTTSDFKSSILFDDIGVINYHDRRRVMVCNFKKPELFANKFVELHKELLNNYSESEEVFFQGKAYLNGYNFFLEGGYDNLLLKKIHFSFEKGSKIKEMEFIFQELPRELEHFCINNHIEVFDQKISKIEIGNFSIPNHGGGKIKNLRVDKIELNDFNNYSESFVLQNLEIDELIIKNSDLGKMKFNGVVIHKLYLENVTLNDCVFNSIEFPEDYQLGKNKDFDKRRKGLSHKQMKDSYRQLKFVMDKSGNTTEANKFFEREMECYMKSLDIKKGFFSESRNLIRNDFAGLDTKVFGEKLVLVFGKTVNEFGNNWMRPMMLIIIFAFFANTLDLITNLFDVRYQGYGDYILLCISLIFCFSVYCFPALDNKISKVFFAKDRNITHFLLISFGVFMLCSFLEKELDFHAIKNLGNLLYPLSWIDSAREYNGLEVTMLLFYKFIYGILIYNLIVALKRTTKR